MDPRDAVMLALQAEGGEPLRGRTLLQKKLYFASVLAGEDLGFQPHYYGPYSQAVADAVNSLVSGGLVGETIETFPSEPNVFGEWRRHSYGLTEDGARVVEASSKTVELTKWREALEKVDSHEVAKDFNLLSVAAKTHLILSHLRTATADEISRQAEEFGWKMSPSDIARVHEYLKHLGLIE